MRVRLIVLGSGPIFPFPRTKTNKFTDYLDIVGYQKKFELHDDLICNLAKKGGEEKRTRSSLAIITGKGTILIDAGPDVLYQTARYEVQPDVVLITHTHNDADYGLRFLPGVKVLSENMGNLELGKRMEILGISVTPFRVNHAKSVKSVGYSLRDGRKKVVYLGDTADLAGVEKWVRGADLVFADGSILEQNMPSHLAIVNQLKFFKKWRPKKVIFTHIGHKTLPHRQLGTYVKNIYPAASIGWDGMVIEI